VGCGWNRTPAFSPTCPDWVILKAEGLIIMLTFIIIFFTMSNTFADRNYLLLEILIKNQHCFQICLNWKDCCQWGPIIVWTKMVLNHRSNNKVDEIVLKACRRQPIKRSVPVLDLLGHMQGSCCNIWYGYQALFGIWYTNLLHSRILTHYYDYWLWLHEYHLQLVYEYLLRVHVFPYTFFDMHSFTYRHQ